MKAMFLTTALALALGGGVPPAHPPTAATHQAQRAHRNHQGGVPRYEMRPNGLMRNGLLPADGEQG